MSLVSFLIQPRCWNSASLYYPPYCHPALPHSVVVTQAPQVWLHLPPWAAERGTSFTLQLQRVINGTDTRVRAADCDQDLLTARVTTINRSSLNSEKGMICGGMGCHGNRHVSAQWNVDCCCNWGILGWELMVGTVDCESKATLKQDNGLSSFG